MTQHLWTADPDLGRVRHSGLGSRPTTSSKASWLLAFTLLCTPPVAGQVRQAAGTQEASRLERNTAPDATSNSANIAMHLRVQRVVAASVPLLQASADTWIRRKSCSSCHHQTLGLMAINVAREGGFEVHQGLADKQEAQIRRSLGRSAVDFAHGVGLPPVSPAYALLGLYFGRSELQGPPPGQERTPESPGKPSRERAVDLVTTTRAVQWLTSVQQSSGAVPSFSHRPPMEHRPATGTALLIHGLRRWGAHLPDTAGARRRAATWLESHEPPDTEASAWRLIGLYWHGAEVAQLRRAAGRLLELQRTDGSWCQHQLRQADAYATGLALTALLQTGQLEAADPRAVAAADWLLADFDREHGAWHVTTRRRVAGLPHFESGFPYGEDQFISYAASAWATTALALIRSRQPSQVLAPPDPEPGLTVDAPCGELPALLCAARYASPDAFLEQLQHSSATEREATGEQGLHLLMAAAGDPAKLAAVLQATDHGTAGSTEPGPFATNDPSHIDRPSELGRRALHLAAMAPDPHAARRSTRLLLDRGANVHVADQNGLTPLHLAARRADPELVRLLLRAGAKTDATAAGIDGMTPLGAAVAAEAPEVVRVLLHAGADPKYAMSDYGSDALQEAVYAGSAEIVELLLSDPARAEELLALADVDGWSAAHYLFLQPTGDPRIAALLLAAGPNLQARDREGRTVVDWARREDLEELLEAKLDH